MVSSVSSFIGSASALAANTSSGAQALSASASSDSNDPVKAFQDFMKETPAERMVDAWLKAHHLTREQLAAMPAAQRDAVEQEMAADIKNQLKQKMEASLAANSALAV